MGFVSLLGTLGGICFAYCGVPLAWASIKAGKGLAPVSTAWGIVIGTIAMYLYLFLTYGFNFILSVNYTVEFLSWATVLYYHYRPRGEK